MADTWTVVRNCSWLHEAELLKSVLESEGIDALIPDEFALGVEPAFSAFGGVRLMVHADALERATDVLAATVIPSANQGNGD